MKPQPRGSGCDNCARPDQWGVSSGHWAGRLYPASNRNGYASDLHQPSRLSILLHLISSKIGFRNQNCLAGRLPAAAFLRPALLAALLLAQLAALHAAGLRPSPSVPIIGKGVRQIFADDVLIASKSGVERKVHAAAKLERPVLEASEPWELGTTVKGQPDRRLYVYGTVLRDAASGLYRMWYSSGGAAGNPRMKNYYATSHDSIAWQRPELGLVVFGESKANNLINLPFHSTSVILDSRETDPAKRYKAVGTTSGVSEAQLARLETRFGKGWPYPTRAYWAAYSADGLQWTLYPENPVLPGCDTITLAQDPETGAYLAFHKRHGDQRTRPVVRQVYLSISKDMQHWSEPELVMNPDEADHAETRKLKEGMHAEFYNMSAFPYAGQWLGLVTVFRRTGPPPVKGPGQSGDDGPIDVQLVHSRDGRKWQRCSDRSPVIALGPHRYDAGSILGVCNSPVIAGDEMWMYYTAITTTHGGALPDKQMAIARAAWRLDGMVSLHAADAEGVIETVPIEPEGDRLFVNADVRTGRLLVEMLDVEGDTVPGYDKSACLPLTSGAVRQEVKWRTESSLPKGKPLRLRFHLTNGDLYSYVFERSP